MPSFKMKNGFPSLKYWTRRSDGALEWSEPDREEPRTFIIVPHYDRAWIVDIIHHDGSVAIGGKIRSRAQDCITDLRKSGLRE